MATKKKRIVKKERTLSEFRAWLEGVEELQGGDWHPDADQWKLIRAAIDGIVEEVVEVYAPSPWPTPVPERATPTSTPTRQEPQLRAEVPSAPIVPVSTQSALPTDVEMTPAAKAALSGKIPANMTPDATGKLKTPNIDTSDGNYGSGFA